MADTGLKYRSDDIGCVAKYEAKNKYFSIIINSRVARHFVNRKSER